MGIWDKCMTDPEADRGEKVGLKNKSWKIEINCMRNLWGKYKSHTNKRQRVWRLSSDAEEKCIVRVYNENKGNLK